MTGVATGPMELKLQILPGNEGPLALVTRAPVLEATDVTLAVYGRSIDVWVRVTGIKVTAGVPAPLDRERIETLVHETLLDAAHSPRAHFHGSFKTGAAPGTVEVDGTLTLRGVARPVAVVLRSDVPRHWSGETTIRQRDFGIEPARAFGGALVSRDAVVLRLSVAAAEVPGEI
jgi:hypothetical protein